jgi:hypothetical protein
VFGRDDLIPDLPSLRVSSIPIPVFALVVSIEANETPKIHT